MSDRTTHRIVVKGHPTTRLLEPLLDDFTAEALATTTQLLGVIRDASHLHGVIAHLTSLGIEVISLTPIEGEPARLQSTRPPTRPRAWSSTR